MGFWLGQKLKSLKNKMRDWRKMYFHEVKVIIVSLLARFQELDVLEEVTPLSPSKFCFFALNLRMNYVDGQFRSRLN